MDEDDLVPQTVSQTVVVVSEDEGGNAESPIARRSLAHDNARAERALGSAMQRLEITFDPKRMIYHGTSQALRTFFAVFGIDLMEANEIDGDIFSAINPEETTIYTKRLISHLPRSTFG